MRGRETDSLRIDDVRLKIQTFFHMHVPKWYIEFQLDFQIVLFKIGTNN